MKVVQEEDEVGRAIEIKRSADFSACLTWDAFNRDHPGIADTQLVCKHVSSLYDEQIERRMVEKNQADEWAMSKVSLKVIFVV